MSSLMIFIYVCAYIRIDVVAGVLFPLTDKSRISDCCSFQGLVRDLMPNKVLLITGNVSRKQEGGMPRVGCRTCTDCTDNSASDLA